VPANRTKWNGSWETGSVRALRRPAFQPQPQTTTTVSIYNLSPSDERLFEQIMERAATDADFRQGLLDDPHATIEAAGDVTLPFSVRFTEKPAGVEAYVVLPDFVGTETALTEGELELVAGGAAAVGISDWCICTEGGTCNCTIGYSASR